MKTFPKPLSAADEKACLERLAAGSQEAKDSLIEHNLRLVAHVAKKYAGPDYEMEDLVSVGCVGLIKAVNTFKPERGSRLSTYAARCIENAILTPTRLWFRGKPPLYLHRFPADCPPSGLCCHSQPVPDGQ